MIDVHSTFRDLWGEDDSLRKGAQTLEEGPDRFFNTVSDGVSDGDDDDEGPKEWNRHQLFHYRLLECPPSSGSVSSSTRAILAGD